jgi:hypothetical protein
VYTPQTQISHGTGTSVAKLLKFRPHNLNGVDWSFILAAHTKKPTFFKLFYE